MAPSDGYRVDTHVHLYPGVSVGDMLSAARRNMSRGGEPVTGILCFTETEALNRFSSLPSEDGGWEVQRTGEPVSLIARSEDGSRIAIVAGRQVVTNENLEVLALGIATQVPDGGTAESTIQSVVSGGGVVVLPWGFGKWLGKRGKIVADLIEQRSSFDDMFLADSAGRPGLWRRPPLFSEAGQKGCVTLAGSDPLPLPGEVAMVGLYGLEVSAPFDPERPFAGFKDWLRRLDTQPVFYGKRINTAQMLRKQLLLRLSRGVSV